MLVAPGANLAGDATDFYDRTAAFTVAGTRACCLKRQSGLACSDNWVFGT